MAKKESKDKTQMSIAILVDGDNATATKLNEVVKFVSGYGSNRSFG